MAITAGYDLELISAFQIIDCSTSFDLHEIPVPTDITGIEHFQSEEKIIKNRILVRSRMFPVNLQVKQIQKK